MVDRRVIILVGLRERGSWVCLMIIFREIVYYPSALPFVVSLSR